MSALSAFQKPTIEARLTPGILAIVTNVSGYEGCVWYGFGSMDLGLEKVQNARISPRRSFGRRLIGPVVSQKERHMGGHLYVRCSALPAIPPITQ